MYVTRHAYFDELHFPLSQSNGGSSSSALQLSKFTELGVPISSTDPPPAPSPPPVPQQPCSVCPFDDSLISSLVSVVSQTPSGDPVPPVEP